MTLEQLVRPYTPIIISEGEENKKSFITAMYFVTRTKLHACVNLIRDGVRDSNNSQS